MNQTPINDFRGVDPNGCYLVNERNFVRKLSALPGNWQ